MHNNHSHFNRLIGVIFTMPLNNVLIVIHHNKNAFFFWISGIFLLSTAALRFNIINLTGIPVGQELSHNEEWIPLCQERVLSKDTINVFPWQRTEQDVIPLIQKENKCRLHFYDKPDMVTCIEALTILNSSNNVHGSDSDEHADSRLILANFMTSRKKSKTDGNVKLYVAFLGDSRIHQIFINFVLMMPFLEDGCPKLREDGKYRHDKCVSVPILDALFSYRSLVAYNNTYMEVVEEWIEGKSMAPNYLVIGSTAHHALKFHRAGGAMPEFKGNITELAFLLKRLEERHGTRMIWWKDELVPRLLGYNHFDKSLLPLNKIVIDIFHKYRVPIEIWDSTNHLFMTYLKLCDAWNIGREAKWSQPPIISHPNSWVKCHDIYHAPQSYATVQGQLLANDLCNRVK